ncbi:MAG: helix-turn-helix transcriptional regulator [Alteraurantiacibacter sp.]
MKKRHTWMKKRHTKMNTNCSQLQPLFVALTERQREAMELLAEGRTSKEIAFQLGISESAAIQRVETVRNKAGGLLRKDLARTYRVYLHDREWAADRPFAATFAGPAAGPSTGPEPACNDLTGKFFQLGQDLADGHPGVRNHAVDELVLADAIPFEVASPWASRSFPVVVPEVLNGRGAVLNRLFAATGIALGMLVICLVLLAVASQIGELV